MSKILFYTKNIEDEINNCSKSQLILSIKHKKKEGELEMDKLKNVADKVVGEVKEAVGKVTGNEELELKGKLQSDKADAAEKIHEAKENLKKEGNELLEKVNDKYDEVKDKLKK